MRVSIDVRNFALPKIAGKRASFRMVLGIGARNTALGRLLVQFPGQDVVGGKLCQGVSADKIDSAVATGDPIQPGLMQDRRD